MANVLIVAYLLIVLALIAVILLQRSEGGGLGMGGGGGGGLVSARGSANLLTRTTGVLAALFMAIAITLTIVADLDRTGDRVLSGAEQTSGGQDSTVLDALSGLQGDNPSDLPVPTDTGTPTAPAADATTPSNTTTPADTGATQTPTGGNSDLPVPAPTTGGTTN